MMKIKAKRAFVVVICMSMLLTLPVFAESKSQSNIQLSAAAQFMVDQGIIKGNSSGNLILSDNVLRGDMAIMLVRAFLFTTEKKTTENFKDVSEFSYYYESIKIIKSLGIAKGDGENFKPGNYMTIQESIWFVERALAAAGYEVSNDDLTALFEGRLLTEYATREDVSTILYFVLGVDSKPKTENNVATITYSTGMGTEVSFEGDHFNDVCEEKTGKQLSYVSFTLPSTSFGKLYYDYSSLDDYYFKVRATDKYFYDDEELIDISLVTFVPGDRFIGTVKIEYTGYDVKGKAISGAVAITVEDDSTSVAPITYSTEENIAVPFSEEDFNEVCEDATGEPLYYLNFTLPDASLGKLFYNYESSANYDFKVDSSDEFYYDTGRAKDYSISDISFEPTKGYSGKATINYTGYSKDGDIIRGVVKVAVDSKQFDVEPVSYGTRMGTPIAFDGEDFNQVCEDASDESLYYLKFSSPTTSYGKLYYGFESVSDYEELVTSSDKYYYEAEDDSFSISDVTFVPIYGYTGIIDIYYTGFSEDGDYISGSIEIDVNSREYELEEVSYETSLNSTVTLDEEDFDAVCGDATDEILWYIRFTNPATSYGRLYYQYESSSEYTASVSSSEIYYYDLDSYDDDKGLRSLSEVTFVPTTGYTGMADIYYTGYSDNGDYIYGVIRIKIE